MNKIKVVMYKGDIVDFALDRKLYLYGEGTGIKESTIDKIINRIRSFKDIESIISYSIDHSEEVEEIFCPYCKKRYYQLKSTSTREKLLKSTTFTSTTIMFNKVMCRSEILSIIDKENS